MLAYTYISPGKFELLDKPKPELQSPRDAIVCIMRYASLAFVPL